MARPKRTKSIKSLSRDWDKLVCEVMQSESRMSEILAIVTSRARPEDKMTRINAMATRMGYELTSYRKGKIKEALQNGKLRTALRQLLGLYTRRILPW